MSEEKLIERTFVFYNNQKRSIFYQNYPYNFEEENVRGDCKKRKKEIEEVEKEISIRWRCSKC